MQSNQGSPQRTHENSVALFTDGSYKWCYFPTQLTNVALLHCFINSVVASQEFRYLTNWLADRIFFFMFLEWFMTSLKIQFEIILHHWTKEYVLQDKKNMHGALAQDCLWQTLCNYTDRCLAVFRLFHYINC